MALKLLDDAGRIGGTSQLLIGSADDDGTGNNAREGGRRLKLSLADQNAMNTELYASIIGRGYALDAPTAGRHDNYAPTGADGFPVGYSRVDVDTTAGDVTLSGLLSTNALDGQEVIVANVGANNLTLNAQDANSTAANRIRAKDNFVIDVVRLVYYKGSVNRWVLVP